MQCTLVVEGNAYLKGNKSSLWIVPGLRTEAYCGPELVEGAVKILGPCDTSFTVEATKQIARFLRGQKCEINELTTVDD